MMAHYYLHTVVIRLFIWLCVTKFCEAFPTDAVPDDDPLYKDIAVLAQELPGYYSNVKQYHRQPDHDLPTHSGHILLRSELYKTPRPLFNDSLTIYFQDFTKSISKPFRFGFYSFSVDKKSRTIRMKTFRARVGSFFFRHRDLQKSYSRVVPWRLMPKEKLDVSTYRTHKNCDMFWKKIAEQDFVGITGPHCLATLGTNKVRISVSMTLVKNKLMYTEGWYKINDGTQMTEVQVPYILKKIRRPYRPVVSNRKLYNDQHQETKPTRDRGVKTDSRKSRSRIDRTGKNRRLVDDDNSKDPKILEDFEEVAHALTAGGNLHFRVELSACAAPSQVKIQRVSFGGKISEFVWVRVKKRRRREFLYFSSQSSYMGSEGTEYISREMTLYRSGKVNVKVDKTYDDPLQLGQQYVFQCTLFSPRKGYGGVRISQDQRHHVREASGFKALTSSVDHGLDLRFVVDLLKCHGSKTGQSIIVGSHISGYDIVNQGDTMEVFIKMHDKLDPTHDTILKPQGFSGQIFKNGEVILTRIGDTVPGWNLRKRLPISPAYQCKLEPKRRKRMHSNDLLEPSVNVFYDA